MRRWRKVTGRRAVLLLTGLGLLLGGCDAQTQATVEQGIITASSSFLGALLRAAIEVAQEDTTTTTP